MNSCISDLEVQFTKDFMSLQVKCLKLIFCQRESWRITKLILVFLSLSTCFGLFSEAFYVVINIRDVLKAADAVGPFLTGLLGIVKYFTFLRNKSGFYKLIDKLNDLSVKSK